MSFCPATMCPLFASNGSPWTGEINATCPQKTPYEAKDGCGWWKGFGGCACDGATSAYQQIAEVSVRGHALVIGSSPREKVSKPTAYDCAREKECEWQIEAGDKLCPPRLALSLGLDPRNCAY